MTWEIALNSTADSRGEIYRTSRTQPTYAENRGIAELVPKKHWQNRIVPHLFGKLEKIVAGLKESGDKTASSFDKETMSTIREHLGGNYRSSFRQRLEHLLADLAIDVDDSVKIAVVSTRNSLVHNGRYKSLQQSDWENEYRRILWLSRLILFKLIGYDGQLPMRPTSGESGV